MKDEQAVSNETAQAQRLAAMQDAIDDFCEHGNWGAAIWKRQSHIAALFALRSSEEDKRKREELASRAQICIEE